MKPRIEDQDAISKFAEMLELNMHSLQEIADLFGVTKSTIALIKYGKNWAHLKVGG